MSENGFQTADDRRQMSGALRCQVSAQPPAKKTAGLINKETSIFCCSLFKKVQAIEALVRIQKETMAYGVSYKVSEDGRQTADVRGVKVSGVSPAAGR